MRCFGSRCVPLGLLQQRSAVWPVLCDLRLRSTDFDFYTGRSSEKEDLSGEDSGDAASGICGNCCDYHGGRIDRKLYYGIYFRRLDVDYTRFAFNFQGRIALNPSIRFGIGGMIFLYVLQPLFVRLTKKIPEKAFSVLTGVLAVLFIIDVAALILQ